MDGYEVDSHSSLVKPLPTAFKTAGVVVLLFIWWQEACNCALRKKMKAPNPKGWPIFGNMLLNGVHLLLCNYIKNHGKVFSFNMFGKSSLVIADPDILKKILVKDFWNFRNRVAVMKTEEQLPQAFFLNAMMLGGASAPRLPRRSAQRKWKGWYPWSKIGWEIDANIRRRCQYRKVGLLFEQNLF